MKDDSKVTQEISAEDKATLELGYGSDLIIDEADGVKLDSMAQIEREKVIEQRRQKREQLIKRFKFIQKQGQNPAAISSKGIPPPRHSSNRSSNSSASRSSSSGSNSSSSSSEKSRKSSDAKASFRRPMTSVVDDLN